MVNPVYLENAKKRIPCVPLLVNVVSKRVRQLNSGFRPMLKPLTREEDRVDTALREIAEGKMTAEIEFTQQGEPSSEPNA